MGSNIQKNLFDELRIFFEPLAQVALNPSAGLGMFQQLGWDIESILGPGAANFVDQVGTIASSIDDIQELVDSPPETLSELSDALNTVTTVMAAVRGLSSGPGNVEVPEIASLPGKLLRDLLVLYLMRRAPLIFEFFSLLDVIHEKSAEPVEKNGVVVRFRSEVPEIDLSQLGHILNDPMGELQKLYVPNGLPTQAEANKVAAKLFPIIAAVLDTLGIETFVGSGIEPTGLSAGEEEKLSGMMTSIWFLDLIDGSTSELGATVSLVPATDEGPGVFVAPFGVATVEQQIDTWTIQARSEANVDGFLITPDAVQIVSRSNIDRIQLSIALQKGTLKESAFLIGSTKDSRLEIDQFTFKGAVTAADNNQDYEIELDIAKGALVIKTGESDGFLQKILPPEGISTTFDFTIGWSFLDGFHFRGSAALEVTIPVHRTFGPITVDSIYLQIKLRDNGSIGVALATSISGILGPVAASVQRIGIKTALSFPDDGGNLGPLNLELPSFLPPLGAGLAVSAGPVTGGGNLGFDPDNKRYDGMLQLKFGKIGLTAVGLITTRMPDGSKGFSMLAFLNVEFTPPIQLSFGFTLSAVGGLVGIHRTMILEVLREGVRNGTLDSILFPQDPVANAARIISDLRALFPPEEDRFVVGPMVRIGYGSPEFITAEIAVIIELPPPVRIALLGQIAAFLPKPEKAVVVLHIDVLGTIDTEKQLLTIDATIYDSRILTYALSGDAALRLKWGNNPVFALSLGGFHPKFSPPPDFPSLRRMRLSLGTGNNPRFNCDAYQALTSNSLQFGARVEVYAKFGATLQGHLGFDALIYFSPFGFDVSISGGVSARYKGRKLAAIRLRLNLSGPTPWYAEGTASFEILWWDVDVHFEKTWGPRSPAEIEAINPWEEFKAALNLPESWGSKLPAGRSMVASLRSLEEEASTNGTAETDSNGDSSGPVADTADEPESPPPKPIVVHPAGTLEVRQKVLPLAMKLSIYGNAPISGYDSYDIGTGDFTREYTEDFFARGQYESLSNSDKVSKPSYELMKNGVAIRARDTVLDDARTQEYKLQYESDYIDDDNRTQTGQPPGLLDGWIARRLLAGAASRKSPLRTTGRLKYARMGKAVKVAVGVERFAIVNAADMTRATGISENDGTLTQMAADQLVRSRIESNPEMQDELLVVPSCEVAK